METCATKSIALWSASPRSPDLNLLETFRGWLRRALGSIDLEDLCKKRHPLGKTAYIARVKGALRSAKSEAVAKNVTGSFRETRAQVVDRNGAAVDKQFSIARCLDLYLCMVEKVPEFARSRECSFFIFLW